MQEPNFRLKSDSERPGFGRFVIEPLEQGYGQTLGNSLRRVLLTSLPGSAITSVKVEGVKHQYATLAGMKEDMVEFILNVKKVRLIVASTEPVKLKLSKKGPGEVKAGDIDVPAGVTITNPDLVLCTLSDKKNELEAEFIAEKGYGYVSIEDKQMDEIGRIPIDALYSPVTRVNYHVDATRVGRMTNLDKLVMEVWTDATVSPLDAIKYAAKVLVSYFQQIVDPKVVNTEENVVQPQQSVLSNEIMKMRIEELDIPTRIVNAMANGGIETVGQLMNAQRAELIKIKNLGAKSLSIVEDKLKEKGVSLTI